MINTPAQEFAHTCSSTASRVAKDLSRLNSVSIEEIKRTKQLADPIELARAYCHLRFAKETIEEAMKEISKTFEVLKTQDYPTMLDDRGVANVPLTDLGRVIGTSTRTFVKVHDREGCMDFLLHHEDGKGARPFHDLPQLTVNANTLAATAKDMAKKGEAFPEYVVDDKGNPVLDELGIKQPLFETGTMDTTTWRKITPK